jgi:ATP-dependent DNA helicase RecG
VRQFCTRWSVTAKNTHLLQLPVQQLLHDAELVTQSGVTYAALILLGTREALGKFLAQAETVFEYRSSEMPGAASQREEFREGFLLFHDRVWNLVNLRNDKQYYQDGLYMNPLWTFNEGSVREAFLNAVAHRDYRHGGSIFVRQYAKRIEVVSPGGFPGGVSCENILDRQFPRNRRIADAMLRCGLVERAGQGVNRMLIESITDSKRLPDYSRSDEYEVFLELSGEMQDPAFVKFLAHLSTRHKAALSSHHYLVLDSIRRNETVDRMYRSELDALRSLGLVGTTGHGRGVRYVLKAATDKRSCRSANTDPAPSRSRLKKQILGWIERAGGEGCTVADLLRSTPQLSRDQLRWILRQLRADGRICSVGQTKAARWVPAGMELQRKA